MSAQTADQQSPVADPDDLVWHYTDGHGLASILRTHVLWATASPFLNDAGEVTLGAGMLKSEMQRRAETEPLYRDLLPLIDREPTEPGERDHGPSAGTFFILSAARDRDLLAMWRLYGGGRESYAIGLDPTVPLATLADEAPTSAEWLIQNRPWRPVRYRADEQQALIDAVFDNLPEELRLAQRERRPDGDIARVRQQLTGLRDDDMARVRQQMTDLRDDMEAALMLIKHVGFVDERETRYCVGVHPSPMQGVPDGMINYRPSRYGMAPYLRLTGADEAALTSTTVRPLPIRALAISPSPNGRAAQTSLADLAAACGYRDVPVLRSQIPFRE